MTFVTSLTLESGDRAALDDVVEDIRDVVRRKGAELKGPHSESPNQHFVPQYKGLDGEGETFDAWSYTVYRRRVEIRGADDLARDIMMSWDFPNSVHVTADIERVQHVGSPA
ncbi:30S ribosomal protein S10 [Halarchaeum salinum]|uniref:Small ribosomal subunit protein uS10 n=1 Tax=Halarchaeum salinum TaxID=489912 RepID=A0AAV3S7I6_9EURY